MQRGSKNITLISLIKISTFNIPSAWMAVVPTDEWVVSFTLEALTKK